MTGTPIMVNGEPYHASTDAWLVHLGPLAVRIWRADR
jgi:hypothetical protein